MSRGGRLVALHQEGPRVAVLVLDRPAARNAISTALARELADRCQELAGMALSEAPSVVLLAASSERAFCVGADLVERSGFDDAQWREQRSVLQTAFGTLRDLPMPTVAVVEGYALGGGCELALSCDVVVAGDTAVLGLPEVGLGLVPGCGGTQLLPRRIGIGAAADLILTGRHVPAPEAYRLGLVDRLVPAGSAGSEARALAEQIATRSPVSLRLAKSALRAGTGRPLEHGLAVEDGAWRDAAFSDDRREGVAAFVERRTPHWPSSVRSGGDDAESGGGRR